MLILEKNKVIESLFKQKKIEKLNDSLFYKKQVKETLVKVELSEKQKIEEDKKKIKKNWFLK